MSPTVGAWACIFSRCYIWVLAHLFALGFFIGSIYRRFGNMGLLIFFAAVVFLLTTWLGLNLRQGTLFAWFSQHTAFELALGLLPVTALALLASHLLLRRAVV